MADTVRLARGDQDIAASYPVMCQLRPHLGETEYLETVASMLREGYELALLERDGSVTAVAGFRVMHMLARGRHLYVDDLVTDSRARSHGAGKALFDWLVELARTRGCRQLELDSGVWRGDAHRFYFARRMTIASYHFSLNLA
jgi:GNAT superfamily N-acetyltransferase